MLEDSCVNKWGEKIQFKGGKWSHVSHDWAHGVISLSACSNVKDSSRLTEEQECWCLQSDQHIWTCGTKGCRRRERERMDGWMNGGGGMWYKINVRNMSALAPRFTTALIKARCQNVFLIEYSAIKMSSMSNQMNTLRTSWLHLSALYLHY